MINDKKSDKPKNTRIALVGHITESYGPLQALPDFLLKNVNEYVVISHPFSYTGIPNSRCLYFNKRRLVKQYLGPKYKLTFFYPIHYFGDILLTLYFILKLKKKWNIFIGCDCLNAFSGLLLRSLGRVENVIFYENEYKVKRFKEELLNKIFHLLNGFVARHSDVVWDSPPNLQEIRKKQGVLLERSISVPHGVDLSKIKTVPVGQEDKNVLVYVGHVVDSKGLQLVVRALREVVKVVPKVRMAIVGSGPYEEELQQLVRDNMLQDNFIFWGYTNHDWTLSYLPGCGIGLAPYSPLDKQALMHAEPLKVKDYLACGLPVIMTNFSEVANEIEKRKMGIAVEYKQKDLKEAILKLLTNNKFYRDCRENVLSYDKNITWDETYGKSFAKTFQILKE